MESDGGGRSIGEGKFSRAVSTRTLTDVIHDEGADIDSGDGDAKEERRGWKHFKDKIRSHGRRGSGGGSAWTSNVAVPASDVPIQPSKKRVMFRHSSGRVSGAPESDPGMQPDIAAVADFRSSSLRRNSSGRSERSARFDTDPSPLRRLQEEEAEEEAEAERAADAVEEGAGGGGEEGAGEEDERPVKMSLMSLLAGEGDEYGMDEEEEDDDDDEGGVAYSNCSICMVRHKGAAFEPCGHSFCRLCSREMWAQGGNCPLCNNYVLEILDIF